MKGGRLLPRVNPLLSVLFISISVINSLLNCSAGGGARLHVKEAMHTCLEQQNKKSYQMTFNTENLQKHMK